MEHVKFKPKGHTFKHSFDLRYYQCLKDNGDGSGVFINITDRIKNMNLIRESMRTEEILWFDDLRYYHG